LAVVKYVPLLTLDRRLLGKSAGLLGRDVCAGVPPVGKLALVIVCKVVSGLLPPPEAAVLPGMGNPGPLV